MRTLFLLLTLALNAAIVGLFLYSKLLPYKDKLTGNYKSIFNFFDNLYTPVFNGLKKSFKPHQVGIGLFIDMTQFILLIILLLLLNFLT